MRCADRIVDMLLRCGTASAVLPPTELYSEGWMLRIVLDYFSRNAPVGHPLRPWEGASWLSECRLPSRFLARNRKDPLREGWTQADGVLGHVRLRPGGRGDIELLPGARQFVVTEAKMYSPLSSGTTLVGYFNQAARNVACMVEVLSRGGITASSLEHAAFLVIAPAEQLATDEFREALDRSNIQQIVSRRVGEYNGIHDAWLTSSFNGSFGSIAIEGISWERLVDDVVTKDRVFGQDLESFYASCKKFNRPRGRPAS